MTRRLILGLLLLVLLVGCAGRGRTDVNRVPVVTGLETVVAVHPMQPADAIEGVEVLDADSALITYLTGGCGEAPWLPRAVTAEYKPDEIHIKIDTSVTCGWGRSIEDIGYYRQMQVDFTEPVNDRPITVTTFTEF